MGISFHGLLSWNVFVLNKGVKFSETILKKEKSILLGILRHVYKIYFSQKSKLIPSSWGLMMKITSVCGNKKFD